MIIRKGVKEDLDAVLDLVRELAEYVNASDQVETTEEDMLKDGFGDEPVFHFYVAEVADKIVGLALYYYGYSTWKGKFLYLEDLVVRETFRGQGIGKALFNRVVSQAQEDGLKLVGWQVLASNENAIAFYKKAGAVFQEDWINCRLYKEQLD